MDIVLFLFLKGGSDQSGKKGNKGAPGKPVRKKPRNISNVWIFCLPKVKSELKITETH